MEASEKARELVEKFKPLVTTWDCYYDTPMPDHIITEDAKQCALIAVEEICEAIDWHEFEHPNKEWDYWQQVKTEIQKL